MREIAIEIPKGFSDVLASQVKNAASAAVSSTLMATKSHWEQVAQQRLNTTRNDYILGLNADNSVQMPDGFTGVLTLRGKWPNMLETGFARFDQKPGFMNSKRKKLDGNGNWYVTVPFRHRTPGTAGSAVGGSAMPEDIYAKARVLANNDRLRGTEKEYPKRTSFTGYQHKAGIYEGMKKITKQYESTSQNQYMTFRRVSEKSDPQSWWHPGFVGIKAIDVVEPFAKDTFRKVLNYNIKKTMG